MIDIVILQQCAPDVHPMVMQRIMHVETQNKPNAIGFRILKNKQDYRLPNQPKTLEEAKHTANWLYQNGYRYDLGIAQVNSANFARFGVVPDDMFNECKNINVASKILLEFYNNAKRYYADEQQALQAAISSYNSGKFNSTAGRQYVSKIMDVNIQYYAKTP
jgi:type IV secretion system protein VirB1